MRRVSELFVGKSLLQRRLWLGVCHDSALRHREHTAMRPVHNTAMLAALALLAAVDVQALIQDSWQDSRVVGHRGAAAYAPENTMRSFQKAISVGAPATECDVWMSRDGEPMVIHDQTLNRTTNLTGRVDQTDAWTMERAGVPTLRELIRDCLNRIVLVIEIKGGINVVPEVERAVMEEGDPSQTIIFSFNPTIVREMKGLNPGLFCVWLSPTGYKDTDLPQLSDRLNELQADAVGFNYRNVTASLAQHLRGENRPLFAWTVPPGPEVHRLRGLGVNFIITDHPRDVRRELGR